VTVEAAELQELELDELAGKLRESRRELYELRFKLAVGQLDNHRQIREVRHDIARILTFMRQREMGVAAEAPAAGAEAEAAEPEAAAEPEEAESDE
jgi:large subunit ribosomal protein L29